MAHYDIARMCFAPAAKSNGSSTMTIETPLVVPTSKSGRILSIEMPTSTIIHKSNDSVSEVLSAMGLRLHDLDHSVKRCEENVNANIVMGASLFLVFGTFSIHVLQHILNYPYSQLRCITWVVLLALTSSVLSGRSAQLSLKLARQLPILECRDPRFNSLRTTFGVRVFLMSEIRSTGIFDKYSRSILYLQLSCALFVVALLSYTAVLPTTAKIVIFTTTLTVSALALFALLAATDPELPGHPSLRKASNFSTPVSSCYSPPDLEMFASTADYVLLDDELLTTMAGGIFSSLTIPPNVAISFILHILENRVKDFDIGSEPVGLLDLREMSLAAWEAVTNVAAHLVFANTHVFEEHAATDAKLPPWAKAAVIVLLSPSGYTYSPNALRAVQKLTAPHFIRHTCRHVVSRSQEFRVLWTSIRRAVHPRAHHHTHTIHRVLSARFCVSHCRHDHESLHDWLPSAHTDARWHIPDVMDALADSVRHHLPELAEGAWHPEAEQALFTLFVWAGDHQTADEERFSSVVLELLGDSQVILASSTAPPRVVVAFLRFLMCSTLVDRYFTRNGDSARRAMLQNITRSFERYASGSLDAEAGIEDLDVLRTCQRPFWMFDATAHDVHRCWPEWVGLFRAMSLMLSKWHTSSADVPAPSTWTSRLAGHGLAYISKFCREMPHDARARGVVFPHELTEILHVFLLPDAFDGVCPRHELEKLANGPPRLVRPPCFRRSTTDLMSKHGLDDIER